MQVAERQTSDSRLTTRSAVANMTPIGIRERPGERQHRCLRIANPAARNAPAHCCASPKRKNDGPAGRSASVVPWAAMEMKTLHRSQLTDCSLRWRIDKSEDPRRGKRNFHPWGKARSRGSRRLLPGCSKECCSMRGPDRTPRCKSRNARSRSVGQHRRHCSNAGRRDIGCRRLRTAPRWTWCRRIWRRSTASRGQWGTAGRRSGSYSDRFAHRHTCYHSSASHLRRTPVRTRRSGSRCS